MMLLKEKEEYKMKKLPIIVDKYTEVKIILDKEIESIQMKANMNNKSKQYKKYFIFPDNNPEDFEIIIRKIK
jgi:hypothetical protein